MQTGSIPNYYEKIRSGNQEKPFHEIILQIGNKDDMSATGEYAELARTVLDKYYQRLSGAQSKPPGVLGTSPYGRGNAYICTLTLCHSPPGASEGLIPVYR